MTGTKTASGFVRLCGVVACVAATVSGWDAEAGWRRRHCERPCCEPVCCETVRWEPACCEPACCEAPVVVAACEPRCTTCFDDCGRRIACGCTVVHSRIVVAAPACCDVATSGSTLPAVAGGPVFPAESEKPAAAIQPAAARSVLQR